MNISGPAADRTSRVFITNTDYDFTAIMNE